MDAETKHYLDECARLGALARERKASADAQARAASITIEQLRARVAELEAALESVCVALLPHDSRCQNVNAVFEAHDRASAALNP
jgi:hypothetical protein